MQTLNLNVSLSDLVNAVSEALDTMAPSFHFHQKRTCVIACKLAKELGISDADYSNLYYASLLHDVGAVGLKERIDLLAFEEHDANLHAIMGAALLKNSSLFSSLVPIVEFHHTPWLNGENQNNQIPDLAHLIHLSDRIEVQCHKPNILAIAKDIKGHIQEKSGDVFKPEYVEAFLKISQIDAFWFDLEDGNIDDAIQLLSPEQLTDLNFDELLGVTKFISLLIDSRSHFTAKHSSGVEKCAEVIGTLMNLDQRSIASIKIAGYLHDIGKLSIPNELLEKPSKLTEEEYALMKGHVYKTFQILSKVKGLKEIALIASSHHEKLNGRGYPFSKTATELSMPQRILAFADIFTALTEVRPYKDALTHDQIREILGKEVASGGLDAEIFKITMDNISLITKEVIEAQNEAEQQLYLFWNHSKN